MNHSLPPSIIELLKQRKLETEEQRYFMRFLDMTPYDATGGVSVVMIVYHTGSVLFESVERVLDDPIVKQFVIIDNGSSEKAGQWLRDLAAENSRVLLVQGHGNIGFAKAVNLGAHLSSEPWLVVLNPDARLRDGCIEKLVEAAKNRNSPCIVGARVLNNDLTEQRGARRGEVTPVTTLLSLSRLSKIVPFLKSFEIHQEHLPLPEGPHPVATISGACFLMSKRDFAVLKGFDTRFFLHVEDVDLCWRARKMGGCVLFHPHAEVVHEGHTSRVHPVTVEWSKGKGLIYFFDKRADSVWRKVLVWTLAPFILGASVGRAMMRRRLREDEE